MASQRLRAAGLAGAFLFLLGACSSPAASTAPSTEASAVPTVAPSASTAPASVAPSAAAIVVPDAIKTAGKLVWCVDVSYPPEESYKADGTTAEGSDIDIATEIGTRFGVTTTIDNTGFDGIIPALNASKCDLIISGMNDTAERAKQVAFVDYLKVGQGLLVPAGNPKGIKTLEDLSGKGVAVELGTTNKDALDAENTKLVAAGKSGVYVWEGSTPKVDPEVGELFVQGDSPVAEDEVRGRALDALAEEIHLMLTEGVVADVRDIDLAMLLGAGWPFHLGGVTPYLDRTGISERVNGARFLEPGVASLPR